MNAPTPDIRKGRKFDQVLEGARKVFMADGFEGASVDDIAKTAGVSKATLYSYFPDKRLLFMEVAKTECCRQADAALSELDFSNNPREVLSYAAEKIMYFLLSDFGQRMYRITVAEGERFPNLGTEFIESGPRRARAALVTYFKAAQSRGDFKIEDFDLAAEQFLELCKADLFPRRLFELEADFTDAEVKRVIDGAVDMFMARYAT
ncbi:TetR/AcrR family transcriptional regulator [Parasulfitobacter algicola]|uniref:TetR/AcrR family transcriptional regulator n=1 Tax=Parasulfitobacter algicola TaxID=2614809 RepID=A0ABX2IU12_9RHOB|nr:TetR/AcrR family transcriptional regulator [Sulfitobacter algicola]NSX56040.1 TetR/AcrR family transcriptional regulator [Sulfitobacter algicola]